MMAFHHQKQLMMHYYHMMLLNYTSWLLSKAVFTSEYLLHEHFQVKRPLTTYAGIQNKTWKMSLSAMHALECTKLTIYYFKTSPSQNHKS